MAPACCYEGKAWDCLALFQQKQALCWKWYKGERSEGVQEAFLPFGPNRVEELCWLSEKF